MKGATPTNINQESRAQGTTRKLVIIDIQWQNERGKSHSKMWCRGGDNNEQTFIDNSEDAIMAHEKNCRIQEAAQRTFCWGCVKKRPGV